MKQALSLLLSASLLMPLAACGGETAPSAPSVQVETQEPKKPEPETTAPPPVVQTEAAEPAEEALVPVADYIPDILTELKYATADNFTGQVIYPFQTAYLRYGTVKNLKAAQESFGEIGLRLKIWDAFRPVSAQFTLWEICPDSTYVADPRKGYSNHSRGNAVDVTLVDAQGAELEMPTAFDDFSGKADRNYADCTETQAENAMLLQTVMERYGFKGYYGEWWHFADEVRYEVEESFDPK